MPNAIKYSTTGDTQSLKKGNFFIGVGDVGKGPTSTTNYYNGITPSTGGYTIYLNKTSGGPSIYVASSDSQLIDFTNKIVGSSYTTAAQCLTYYSTQTDKMVLNRDYESIVTSGLTLNLDAGFTPSYPTTGTTWYDLSYSGNNGTLINSPTYNSTDGGSIVFDGVNDYVSILNNTTVSFTIGCWISTTATSLTGSQAYEGNGIVWSDVAGIDNDFVLSILNNKASWFTGDNSTTINSTTTINTGSWFYITVVKNGINSTKELFINSISESTGTSGTSTLTANPNISIGGNTLDSKYFNGKIAQVTIYNRVLSASEILQNYTAISSRFSSLDPDAQAFITAAAITGSTQQNAINTLVISLKGYGIWVKMKALYPFVGGTASQHKFNLKNPLDTDAAFRLVFVGGWVHSANGITSNGTNSFADTKLIYTTLNSGHMSLYSRSNVNESGTVFDMGCTNAGKFQLLSLWGGIDLFLGGFNSDSYPRFAMTDSSGLFINNRTTSTATNLWRNGGKLTQSSVTVSGVPNLSNYIGAYQLLGGQAANYSTKNYAFSSIGDGLTDTEAANYYTAVQTFQTTLERQVGVPIVSDSDAQAFLNAAYITNTTQATAVNTLVISLKSYGIWTKMKAVYPFVGGTATTHKFNLKNPLDTNAAFRLTFTGGWTHSSTGALPNGTNGYADTFFSPSMYTALTDASAGVYTRTNISSNTQVDMGQGNATFATDGVIIYSRFGSNVYYSCCNGNTFNTGANSDSRGFFTTTRTGTSQSFRKRGTSNIDSTVPNVTTTAGYTGTIFIGASNELAVGSGKFPSLYSAREIAFAFIADYLSQSEIDNYYTAVQAFQTSLSRNV